MKAAFIRKTGPPEVIEYGELPDPRPRETECLVKVSAVDVNPIDVYIRLGTIAANLRFPYIIGRDLAGTVVQAGAKIKQFKRGDRVWVTGQGVEGRQGTFAELVAVEEQWLHPLPDGVKDEDVAAISLVGITAHLGLFKHARLQKNETVFVNGGSGGVGSSVIQMARNAGARVITTAGSDAKVEDCLRLGAEVAINYRSQNVEAEILKAAPEGVNVWWETLREPNFDRTIKLLAKRGRMVVMAGRDARPAFPVGAFYTKDLSLHGFAMFNSSAEEQARSAEAINEWLAAGKLKARIDRVMPLSEAREAHRLQEVSTIHNKATLAGKIVLRV
jgi:NADPH2:quinone reductase